MENKKETELSFQKQERTVAFDPSLLAAAVAERERRLDEALEETFPASDPISPMCPLSFR